MRACNYGRLWLYIGVLWLFACFTAAASVQAAAVKADAPEIQYYGRWDKQADAYRCGYGATYIKVNFTGTSIFADLHDDHSLWQVSIDGAAYRRIVPEGARTLLAKNLPLGKHKLVLFRQNEGLYGISEFRGFTVPGGSLLPGDAPLGRRLEFVGDSITAGFHNLLLQPAEGSHERAFNELEDGNQSYAPVLARMLQADFSVIAKSGQGVVQNYCEPEDGKAVHCIDSYGWTFFSEEKQGEHPIWHSEEFPVDAVIVSMGANDFLNANSQRVKIGDFVAGYQQLLQRIAEQNPDAAIICLEPLPACLGSEPGKAIAAAVEGLHQAGMVNLHYIPINQAGPLLTDRDYVDNGVHPTPEGAYKLAKYLKNRVAKILHW